MANPVQQCIEKYSSRLTISAMFKLNLYASKIYQDLKIMRGSRIGAIAHSEMLNFIDKRLLEWVENYERRAIEHDNTIQYRHIVRGRLVQILFRCAMHEDGTVITNRQLASELGFLSDSKTWKTLVVPLLLDTVEWCREQSLPCLPALVVRGSGAGQGLPGPWYWRAIGFKSLYVKERQSHHNAVLSQIHDALTFHGRHYNYLSKELSQ